MMAYLRESVSRYFTIWEIREKEGNEVCQYIVTVLISAPLQLSLVVLS